jgi:hypothetical protein
VVWEQHYVHLMLGLEKVFYYRKIENNNIATAGNILV